jgi:hypothetical protein
MRRILVAVLLVAACGSDDPLAGVENCTELAEAVDAHLETIEGDADALSAFAEEVDAVASEMGGDAIARGADTEAMICAAAATNASGESMRATFDEISSGLD